MTTFDTIHPRDPWCILHWFNFLIFIAYREICLLLVWIYIFCWSWLMVLKNIQSLFLKSLVQWNMDATNYYIQRLLNNIRIYIDCVKIWKAQFCFQSIYYFCLWKIGQKPIVLSRKTIFVHGYQKIIFCTILKCKGDLPKAQLIIHSL